MAGWPAGRGGPGWLVPNTTNANMATSTAGCLRGKTQKSPRLMPKPGVERLLTPLGRSSPATRDWSQHTSDQSRA